MGLKSADQVTDRAVIINPDADPTRSCNTPIVVSQNQVRANFGIQDAIEVIGPRYPTATNSQKSFTFASVLVVPQGYTPTTEEVTTLTWIAEKFPLSWYKSTGGLSSFNNIVPEDATNPTISNVQVKNSTITFDTDKPTVAFVIFDVERYGNVAPADNIYPRSFVRPPQYITSHLIKIPPLSTFGWGEDWQVNSIKGIIVIDENFNMGSDTFSSAVN